MSRSKKVDLALLRVNEQIVMKQRRTGARRVADVLCQTYVIRPDSNDIVADLTSDARIRTNREAVAAWVESQLENPGPLLMERVLPILVDLLGRKLRSIYEGDPCL